MIQVVLNKAAFGGRFWMSAFMYLGLGLLLLAISPGMPVALAQGTCGGESECDSGYFCCGGTCIPDTEICCGDGTYGDATSCECCSDCDGEQCETSTVFCAPLP